MKLSITLVLWLFAGAMAEAQPEPAIIPARMERAPHLSGEIDATWDSAAVVSDFHQREPYEGRPATERTVVRVAYDKHNLYFAVYCYDNPKGITATELRRDTDYTVDDYVSILISPRNDHRNGYVFTVNPLGTQFDALIADEGRVNDANWDGIWKSEARIVADGWTATIAIPFSTLNFKTYQNTTVGVNFSRFIRRKNEEDLWRAYLRIYGLLRVSEAGELSGLKDIGSGRLLIVKPYALAGYRSNEVIGKTALHSGGADLKYGITSNLLANVTVNTDFADADVDPLRLNLTPFKIFLPEKRPFFLENSGIFQFGDQDTTQLFFSRQIGIDPASGEQVPLDAGAKLTGSVKDFDLGVLDAHTRESGFNPAANYTVARVKRRFLAESYVGAIGLDKESSNPADSFNRAAGLDLDLVLWKKWTVFAYYGKTFSPQPPLQGKDWADNVTVSYDSNLIQALAQRKTVQPNFNPEVGFVDRTDLVTNYLDLTLSPRPRSGPVREYNFEGFFRYEPDTRSVLQTQEWQTTFRALFHNGSYTDDDIADNFIQRLTSHFNIFKNVFIPAGLYHFDRHQFTYGSDLSKKFVFNVFERFGTYYNGTLNEFQLRQRYHPNPRISFMASESWDRFRLAGLLYNVYVGSWSAGYSFSRFLATSALVQLNSVDNHPVSVNLRLRYTYRPDSDLFVIYNVGSQFNSIAAGNPVLTQERRLTVKLTYSYSR